MRGRSRARAVERTRARAWALALLAAGTAGCAKDPTDLQVYVGEDATVTQAITSMRVTVACAQGVATHDFQALSAPAADADIPQFPFPALLDTQLTRDGVSGACQVTVDARDPTIDDTILASGTVAATVRANATTKVSIILTAVSPSPGAGGAGGSAGGAGGGASGAGGSAGGAGGSAGARGTGGLAGAGGSGAAGAAG